MSKSNVVALFAAIPSELSALAIELVKLRASQNEKADLSALTVEVFTLFSGNVEAAETPEPEEKPLTAAQKKKAAAEKAAADKAAAAEAEAEETAGKATGKKDAKKKPAGKKETKPEIDLTPFKEQVGDFLEWLGSDKEDEIAKILEEFDAETADDVADESYTEFYKLVRELTAEEFDLSEVEDLLAA